MYILYIWMIGCEFMCLDNEVLFYMYVCCECLSYIS